MRDGVVCVCVAENGCWHRERVKQRESLEWISIYIDISIQSVPVVIYIYIGVPRTHACVCHTIHTLNNTTWPKKGWPFILGTTYYVLDVLFLCERMCEDDDVVGCCRCCRCWLGCRSSSSVRFHVRTATVRVVSFEYRYDDKHKWPRPKRSRRATTGIYGIHTLHRYIHFWYRHIVPTTTTTYTYTYIYDATTTILFTTGTTAAASDATSCSDEPHHYQDTDDYR